MNRYSESGLIFNFPDDWKVFPFDQHRFYRYVSGYGLKGVDFIGITPEKKLVLIEVKNYFDRFPKDGVDPLQRILEDPWEFAEQMILKFEDSFSLIKGIQQYYQRRTWFKWIAAPMAPFLPESYLLSRDWGFWSTASQLLSENKLDLVLWFEAGLYISEEKEIQLIKKINAYFSEEFKEHPIFLANRKTPFQNIIAHHED